MAAVDEYPMSAAPKISRYRSQRRPNNQSQSQIDPHAPLPSTPPHDSPAEGDSGVARSKSRYHRKNTLDSQNRPTPDSVDLTHRPRQQYGSPPRNEAYPAPVKQASDGRGALRTTSGEDEGRLNAPRADLRRLRSVESNLLENGQRERLERKYSLRRSAEPILVSAPSNPFSQLSPPPTGQLFPPPRPDSVKPPPKPFILDGPPSSDQIKATRSTIYLPKYSYDDGEAGCFAFFKRKRGETSPQPAGEKDGIARSPKSKQTPTAIIAGGGATPGTDAPVSAVNAGDRRVLIQCGKTKTIFPVTPTTTPVDIIKSAETVLSERINLRSAVLLEYFGTVGVQRPLRRYEHIRDVMNSWDSDRQNSLVLVDPGVGSSEIELSIAGVPAVKPEEASWSMSYSQKVGKWDKRLVTLKSDGQITVLKDVNKPQQAENVCHLSDFDIYTPTQEKMRKKIKPPKKHCFAIKSQQKTAMFEETQNFVHFFSTGDRTVSDDFYRAIQSWRSWYLVNVMGEGKKSKEGPTVMIRHKPSSDFQRGHRVEESFSSHYQLGSFKPLIDNDQLDKKFNNRPTSALLERQTSTRRKEPGPPVAIHTRGQLADDEPLMNLARRNSYRGSGDFTTRESFDVRRNNSTRGTRPRAPTNDLPAAGLTRTRSNRDGSRARDASVDLARSSSRRSNNGNGGGAGRPLVDLTPEYKQPPQHTRKGRAHRPDHVGPGGLVDAATSPDDVLGVPSSTDWRGPQYHSQNMQLQNEMRTTRTRAISKPGPRPSPQQSQQQQQHNFNSSVSSRSPDGPGFTGEGLLAGSQQGWGGENRGRGVIDGTHACGPMVDLRENSRFAGGSLLERVERAQGGPGPQMGTVDR